MAEPTHALETADPEPWDYDDEPECWKCGGLGIVAGCFEDTCFGLDCDPEEPEYCCAPERCDVCGGKGRFPMNEAADG